jgi:hypothetical protein
MVARLSLLQFVSGIRSRDCTESALESLRNKWESKNEQ